MKFAEMISFDPSLLLLSSLELENEKKSRVIQGIAGIETPAPHHIVFAKNAKILARLGKQNSLADYSQTGLILEKAFYENLKSKDPAKESELQNSFAFLAQTNDVALSMALLSRPFYDKKCGEFNHYVDGRQMGTSSLHPTAMIAQNVFIGENVIIGENVRIYSGVTIMGPAEIGANTTIFPNVTLYPFVKTGRHCRIHAGTVIGADGFGYHFHQGVHHKIWHSGGVILADHVEIGANSAVDSGTFAPTLIGEGSKLDNCVQVGHNCRLGRGVVLCGHVAIGGSSTIGDYTVFGGKSGMGSDMTLGMACQVAGGALVNCDWPDRSVVGGHPARPLKEWMRGIAYLRKMSLPEEMAKKSE